MAPGSVEADHGRVANQVDRAVGYLHCRSSVRQGPPLHPDGQVSRLVGKQHRRQAGRMHLANDRVGRIRLSDHTNESGDVATQFRYQRRHIWRSGNPDHAMGSGFERVWRPGKPDNDQDVYSG